MNKYYGKIGFAITSESETQPGVWIDTITEKYYYMEIKQNVHRLETVQQINFNININNKFSIIADPFAANNFNSMRYLEYQGTLWKITQIEVESPRLILTVGGVFNE